MNTPLADRIAHEAEQFRLRAELHNVRNHVSAAEVAHRAHERLTQFAANVVDHRWRDIRREWPACDKQVMVLRNPRAVGAGMPLVFRARRQMNHTWLETEGRVIPMDITTHWQPWVCPDDTDGDGNCWRPACPWCGKAMA